MKIISQFVLEKRRKRSLLSFAYTILSKLKVSKIISFAKWYLHFETLCELINNFLEAGIRTAVFIFASVFIKVQKKFFVISISCQIFKIF